MRVDAHQHFWRFDPVRDHWIKAEMAAIQKDFMPQDLWPQLSSNGFDGCIAIQASQSEEETNFLVELASEHSFIKGVVGWVNLQAENVIERLEIFSQQKVIKGFRHVLQGEPQRDLMLSPRFLNGIAALNHFGFTYDLLILPDQLTYAKKLVAQYPDQKFVVDHLAKPLIKQKEINEWTADMEALAKQPNVWCKLSGMVTEANWMEWQKDDLQPYMDIVVEAFGINRIIFGSDWPVCLLAASYHQTVEVVKEYFSFFSASEQQQVFGGNATAFYNL